MRWLLALFVSSLVGTATAAPAATVLASRVSLAGASLEHVSLADGTSLRASLAPSAPVRTGVGFPPGRQSRAGVLETAPVILAPFDVAVVSWNALTPRGTWLRVDARARLAGRWTRYYALGVWSTDTSLARHSFGGEADGDGRVSTDTLKLARAADAIQLRVTLGSTVAGAAPTLTALAIAPALNESRKVVDPRPSDRRAWGKELPVPAYSQMVYPDGGRVWCSPTSTTMLLAYWGERLGKPLADKVPVAARLVWDSTYQGAGNWPFNTAYASSKGLLAYVGRLSSLAQAEAFIARGVPLALSVAWGKGELAGAHLPSSDGHLVVLRGFEANGDAIVNDPAAPADARVRTVYRRAELERAWVGHSGGIVYVIEPPAEQ